VGAARERSQAIRKRARIPAEMRDEWQRLERAYELVVGLVDEGWVTDEAIARLDVRIGRSSACSPPTVPPTSWAAGAPTRWGGRSTS
jgi:hypothetical protein